jgi:hypothetical protein
VLCEDSDDNGEWPNTASVPSLPISRKRPRDKEESSNETHPRNEDGPGNKTATGSAEFVVDLELADELEVSPHRKRRGVTGNGRSEKSDAAGKCAQILKGVDATEKDVCSVDAQVADHRESHEGLTAAASHSMISDSEQTSRDDGSANKHSQQLSPSELPSSASGRRWRVTAWKGRMSELADYSKIHGHCNVPHNYSENAKLGKWAAAQRYQHKLHREGKPSTMTLLRIQELESLGFEWGYCVTAWEDRLSELTDYRKIHGHCNVRKMYSEDTKLGKWVKTQRTQYRLHVTGKQSQITFPRIQKLESLGFDWGSASPPGKTV